MKVKKSPNREISGPGKMLRSIFSKMLPVWDMATFLLEPYFSGASTRISAAGKFSYKSQ